MENQLGLLWCMIGGVLIIKLYCIYQVYKNNILDGKNIALLLLTKIPIKDATSTKSKLYRLINNRLIIVLFMMFLVNVVLIVLHKLNL